MKETKVHIVKLKLNAFVGILFFAMYFPSYNAQQIQKVSNVKGIALISGDISPNEAKKIALSEAKVNALKTAGIKENLSSYQVLLTSQLKNDYSQFFSSDIQTEIQGAVQSYDVTSERIYCKNDLEVVYEIILDANVIIYSTRPDASFDMNVEGIKTVYINDEKLLFTVKTTQSGYLTVFNITDTEAILMFPNDYERQSKCIAFEVHKFPVGRLDYVMHTEMKEIETNRLIFVLTKTPVPFIKMNKDQITTSENIFAWIYSITPDQRKVDYKTLVIQKQ